MGKLTYIQGNNVAITSSRGVIFDGLSSISSRQDMSIKADSLQLGTYVPFIKMGTIVLENSIKSDNNIFIDIANGIIMYPRVALLVSNEFFELI